METIKRGTILLSTSITEHHPCAAFILFLPAPCTQCRNHLATLPKAPTRTPPLHTFP